MTERDVAEDAIAVIEGAADDIESGMDENLIPYLRESADELTERLEGTAGSVGTSGENVNGGGDS